jgi:hypothetical protein
MNTIFFSGRLFALISQYQETFNGNYTDFYRFLYNRSKIKPLTYYFNTDTNSPKKDLKLDNNTSSNEKSQFNFDFKKHASIAKLKEDELDEKIEKWLENVERNDSDTEEFNPKDEIFPQEEIKIPIRNEQQIPNTVILTDSMTETNEKILSPNKPKKQTFRELFEEKTIDISSKKKISALDAFDKLLLEKTDNGSKQSVSMEIDIKQKNEEVFENDVDSKSMDLNTQTVKKESQTKIHDYFKLKDA